MADITTGQDVDIIPPGSVGSGKKTVTSAGTAEALAGSTSVLSVTIRALGTNTGQVYVGNSGVDSTNGFQLDSGDTVSLDIDDLSDVYIDVDTSTEGVTYLYVAA